MYEEGRKEEKGRRDQKTSEEEEEWNYPWSNSMSLLTTDRKYEEGRVKLLIHNRDETIGDLF